MLVRILFVERDPTTADLLVASLERRGYQVTVAHGQTQANRSIRALRPDLLIIDVASFGSQGYKVAEATCDRLPETATILLLPEGHAALGGSAGAFMTPPFTSRRLLYRVNKMARTIPSRDIRVGSLALDPYARTLRRGGAMVRLRPKEAALLALLMRNRGKVLSRRRIMREVWETDSLGDTGTLNVHVRWLRLKIEEDPGKPRWLRTVRGVGYLFDVPEQGEL